MTKVVSTLDLQGNVIDNAAYGAIPGIAGGRLTLTSGTPVTTSDVTGSTLYYTSYTSSQVSQWDGTRVRTFIFGELSVALSGLTAGKNYDVYMTTANNVPQIGTWPTPWSSDTSRGYNLIYYGGVLCVSSGSYRYLGTIRAASASTTVDTQQNRWVWNAANRVPRTLFSESTTSHTYATAGWRQWNGGTGCPYVTWVQGQAEAPLNLGVYGEVQSTMTYAYLGLGFNGSGPAGIRWTLGGIASCHRSGMNAPYDSALGYNFCHLCEFVSSAMSATFTGGGVSGTVLA